MIEVVGSEDMTKKGKYIYMYTHDFSKCIEVWHMVGQPPRATARTMSVTRYSHIRRWKIMKILLSFPDSYYSAKRNSCDMLRMYTQVPHNPPMVLVNTHSLTPLLYLF